MNKFEPKAEDIKKPETQEIHEAPRKVENPEDLRKQMASQAEKETNQFKKECTDDLTQVEARAEKDGLSVEAEDKQELEELNHEAETAKAELAAEINSGEIKNAEHSIVKVTKDKNFEGSIIVQTEDSEGRIAGYALRKNRNGDLEGNKIGYMRDGSIAWTQQLHEADLAALAENGILEKYESALIDEKNSTTQERTIESPELLETKDASKKLMAAERSKLAREFWEQRKVQKERLSKLKGVVDIAQEKIQGEKGDEQVGRLADLQAHESNTFANRISNEQMTEEIVQDEKENLEQVISNSEAVSTLKKKLEEHYANADAAAQRKFETVRKSVEQVLQRNDAFIVHAFLLDEKLRHNENSNISSRASLEDDLDILLSLEPSISTSSVKPGSRHELWSEGIGVLVGGGEVMGGAQTDEGTRTAGIKYRNGTKLTSEQIDVLVSDKSDRGYNELVVNNPKVFGFYHTVKIDDLGNLRAFNLSSSSELNKSNRDAFMDRMDLATKKGMPLLVMTSDRHVYEFVSVDEKGVVTVGREITPEEVAKGNAGYSNEQRKKIGEGIISKNLFKNLNDQKEVKEIVAGFSQQENRQDAQFSNAEYLNWLKDNKGGFGQLPEELLSDKEFMLEAAPVNPFYAYINAGENLKLDVDFVKKLYETKVESSSGLRLYQVMPDELKKNKEIIKLAIEDGDLSFLDASLEADPEIWKKIVDKKVQEFDPNKGSEVEIGKMKMASVYFQMKEGQKTVNLSEKLLNDLIPKLNQAYPNYSFANYYGDLEMKRIS